MSFLSTANGLDPSEFEPAPTPEVQAFREQVAAERAKFDADHPVITFLGKLFDAHSNEQRADQLLYDLNALDAPESAEEEEDNEGPGNPSLPRIRAQPIAPSRSSSAAPSASSSIGDEPLSFSDDLAPQLADPEARFQARIDRLQSGELASASDGMGRRFSVGRSSPAFPVSSNASSADAADESPALENSAYAPDVVAARIKPPYNANPAHDPGSNLFNPHKDPEPLDAAAVYSSATRIGMGQWVGRGSLGWYQYFYDNVGTVHFSGIVSEQDVPVTLRRK